MIKIRFPALRALAFILLTSLTAHGHAADAAPAPQFTPPDEKAIPNDKFGDMIRLGRNIFTDTHQYAGAYTGNGLNCVNCHLDRGRLANASPLWAAYVSYPAFRKKTGAVSTYEQRLQGCFNYSMNGKAPPLGSKELTALVAYSYWLATGAPTGKNLAGRGYPELAKPPLAPDFQRGGKVYQAKCAICHGVNGEGTRSGDRYAFPPLWGNDSYNWGAGMHRINTAASFIKANMPLGQGNTLSDQNAWDVAAFVNGHERPQDPRFAHSLAETRKTHHDEDCSYGKDINGQVLGAKSVPPGGTTRARQAQKK